MKMIERASAIILSAVIIMMLGVAAFASGSIDLDRDISLTISYQDKDTPLAGAQFDLYYVAEMDSSGALRLTGDFSGYNIDLDIKNDRNLAITLSTLVVRDKLAPLDSGKTDENGLLSFPTSGRLNAGIYLVVGHRHIQNGMRYDAAPFIVQLPGRDAQSDSFVYEIFARAKNDSDADEPGTIIKKIIKIWDDNGFETQRPDSIKVGLYCDGELFDTQILSPDNNWYYVWEGLDSGHVWTVAEISVTEGYKVEITQEGDTVIIINSIDDTAVTPSPEVSEKPETSTPPGENKPMLPQTGQLWWPVPVLLCAGLLLAVLGLIRRKGS